MAFIHTPKHNLPPQNTTFVGRQNEIAAIIDKLNNEYCRLLTLAGSGGMGKTRLAIQIASKQIDHYKDGVYFINLQPIGSSAFIMPAIADALGFSIKQTSFKGQLLNALRDQHILLILDNFEHLLDAATLLSEIVATTQRAKLLVTSREVLNLQEEWVHHVEGMRFPDDDAKGIEAYSAIQLFVERAQQVQHNFRLADQMDCVKRICQLVEGMPLGIELAAAWLKTLPCAEIANTIANNLESPHRNPSERHRSIRAVFEYSWKLLPQDEQETFARLSVFWGSFDLLAAEQVAGSSLMNLSSLIDKSMLRINRDGRYEIHELMRQLAHEQLAASGAVDQIRDAHSTYYLNFLQDREADVKGRRQLGALDEIDDELENIRVAWHWAVDQRSYELIDGSMDCLRLFCRFRNHWVEGKELFRYAKDTFNPDHSEDALAIWGRLLTRHTSFHDMTSTIEEVALAEKGLAIARQRGDLAEEAFCLLMMARIALHVPEHHRAISYADESLAYYQAIGDEFYTAIAIKQQARYYRQAAQYEKSIALWQLSCDLTRKVGDKSGLSHSLQWLGLDTFRATGDYEVAGRYWKEAYQIRCEIKQPDGIAASGGALSEVVFLQGDIEKAKILTQETIELQSSRRGSWREANKWSQRRLGIIAIAQRNYKEAHQLLIRNRATESSGVRAIYYNEVYLALTYYGLGDFDNARINVGAALKVKLTNFAPLFWTKVLPPAAMILAHDGEFDLATQLLGLAFTYPGTHVAMMQDWAIVTELIDQLKDRLGSDEYNANWDKGAALDLLLSVAVLRERFNEEDDKKSHITHQGLPEPLSERELEVLQLIADGFSNREIAQRLVVTVGTVKKHNHNIFGKLQASNRTQAVARARALHLIS